MLQQRITTLVWIAIGLAACAPGTLVQNDGAIDSATTDTATADAGLDSGAPVDIDADLTPDMLPDGDDAIVDAAVPDIRIGGQARVTATALNLRSGPTTSDSIITSMPCGTTVDIVGGPMNNWWNVRYNTNTGWSSGTYLIEASAFDPAVCEMPAMTDAGTMADGGTMSTEVATIFQLARSGVGYSYYWGHGSWSTTGGTHGSCSGSCPGCTHTGVYGADCSGFVAKVWQIPTPSPVTTDRHPYSTYNFVNSTTHWSRVNRSSVQPGDALTYNTNGAGHIFLYESQDPWGSMWAFEARGCATGIVHNIRTASSAYIAIRREGL